MKQQTEKPTVTLIGEDGNIFNLVGIASKALKKAGQPDKASEMATKVFNSGSYDEALNIIGQYCEIE
jgi:hypothetical protein